MVWTFKRRPIANLPSLAWSQLAVNGLDEHSDRTVRRPSSSGRKLTEGLPREIHVDLIEYSTIKLYSTMFIHLEQLRCPPSDWATSTRADSHKEVSPEHTPHWRMPELSLQSGSACVLSGIRQGALLAGAVSHVFAREQHCRITLDPPFSCLS